MESDKSLDESKLIAALLHDIHMSHGVVFNNRSLRLTLQKVNRRLCSEGSGFLTKTLPRLCKHFDKCLTGQYTMDAARLGFKSLPNSKLPRFLGEFFQRVLQSDGSVQQNPCVESIKVIRQISYLFYKYELPYTDEQEQEVISRFEKTEEEIKSNSTCIENLDAAVRESYSNRRRPPLEGGNTTTKIAREAKILLSSLFACFDPIDIYPRHGPGVVATKQRLWAKYQWTNVSRRITSKYPLDAFFFASLGHLCDRLDSCQGITDEDLPARVVLVPKDSRGPRLISCEPVDFQWVQQGLGRAIVKLVERHPLTRENVRFTDQTPNRNAALLGSRDGRYSTLDLNEASDRVSVRLVRLLFPPHICEYLEACRSLSTELPDGRVLALEKFAPMGSSLCFPILALTIWAILSAGAPDAYTRERIYVYGDDVIVPTAYAANAIEHLESFGLKINRDKSCTSGLFRESCGMDAFQGVDVTPVRLRTVWSSNPSASVFTSWIAYANSFYAKQYLMTYDLIVGRLRAIYGSIPGQDMQLRCPSLADVPVSERPKHTRTNKRLQKREYRVWDVKSPSVIKEIDGWSMLLRYFAETANGRNQESADETFRNLTPTYEGVEAFSASKYTSPRTSMLVRGWR